MVLDVGSISLNQCLAKYREGVVAFLASCMVNGLAFFNAWFACLCCAWFVWFVFSLLTAFCGPADGVCCDPIAVKTRVLCIGISAAARSVQALTTFVWTMRLQFAGNLV